MNSLMNEALRVESADLDIIAALPNLLPIRIGKTIAGQSRIEKIANKFLLELGSSKKFLLQAKQFSLSESRRSFCFLCPHGEKWRKRLFLNDVSFGPLSRASTHAFQCMGRASTKNKRSSRLAATRSR